MVKNRLYRWLENKDILPNNQYGFRNNRSCSDNLAILISDINLGWYNNKDTCAVFLDIKGAFDNVICDILIKKLIKIKVPTPIVRFIANLISRREVHYKFDDIDLVKIVNKGLPQGTVLSPLLYSVYVSELGILARNPNIRILQFADDVCFYTSHNDTQTALNAVEEITNSSVDWFAGLGLSVAPEKSQLCIFSRNRIKYNIPRNIEVKGTIIAACNKVRFLDLTLQDNLKWNNHVDEIINRCDKALNVIKFLRTTWYETDPLLLLTIHIRAS